ncbi:MAG: hypothetical protein ACKOA9_12060 [Actinomycetota bacterium]
MLRSLLLWTWRWFFRNWRRNLQRVSTTTAVLALARQVVHGKPETIFHASMEPGSGLEIRVSEPGER